MDKTERQSIKINRCIKEQENQQAKENRNETEQQRNEQKPKVSNKLTEAKQGGQGGNATENTETHRGAEVTN